MLDLARNGYTAAQVRAALLAPSRRWSFRYDLLDKTGAFKATLATVLAGSVRYQSQDAIKRTARFSLQDDDAIDYGSDRIKPYVLLHMPDGGRVEFPQGVFLLSTPPRRAGEANVVTREVEAYDLAQVLQDDAYEDRYSVAAGDNYIAKVQDILTSAGFTAMNLVPCSQTLPAARDWAPCTPKAKIIDDLLAAINYRPLWMDENGIPQAAPYVSPAQRGSEWSYADNADSVILPETEQGIDYFKIPNKWVLTVSEADRSTLTSVYTNGNPNSPTSTVSRGRTIMAPLKKVEAATQADLDGLAARIAFEESQVFETVSWQSVLMPVHGHEDVYQLTRSVLGMAATYLEFEWELELQPGVQMKHTCRRITPV